MTTNERKSTRIKTALATLSCLVLLLGTVAVAPLQAHAQGSKYALTVRNRSANPVYRLYVSPSNTERWGPDQLGNRVIVPGSDFTLTNILPGEYDLKAVDEYGNEAVRRQINVFSDRSWTLY
jgi:hypothetical protein